MFTVTFVRQYVQHSIKFFVTKMLGTSEKITENTCFCLFSGETKMNAAKIVQSRTPGELSERGVKMVSEIIRKCKFFQDCILKWSTSIQ